MIAEPGLAKNLAFQSFLVWSPKFKTHKSQNQNYHTTCPHAACHMSTYQITYHIISKLSSHIFAKHRRFQKGFPILMSTYQITYHIIFFISCEADFKNLSRFQKGARFDHQSVTSSLLANVANQPAKSTSGERWRDGSLAQ